MNEQQAEQPQPIAITTREQAVEIIDRLYPADHENPLVHLPGTQLLLRALAESWRESDDKVLFRYAELCLAEQEKLQRVQEASEDRGV